MTPEKFCKPQTRKRMEWALLLNAFLEKHEAAPAVGFFKVFEPKMSNTDKTIEPHPRNEVNKYSSLGWKMRISTCSFLFLLSEEPNNTTRFKKLRICKGHI